MIINGIESFKNVLTISNMITIGRIVVIPWLIHAIKANHWGMALMLFLVAAVSDVADGFLARLFNQQSLLGAILDPIADKLLLASCYMTFMYYPNTFFTLPTWFYYIIFTKEIILLIGAGLVVTHYAIAIKPTLWGKMAMFMQSVLVAALLVSAYYGYTITNGIVLGAAMVAICTVIALIEYGVIAFKQIGY